MQRFIHLLAAVLILASPQILPACSSFQLRSDTDIVYAHNLNQGDAGIPGQMIINKRGVFKCGRTLSELTAAHPERVSDLVWISRYGSVTINTFGQDMPDGGVNEAGLFIWEMSEDAQYPDDRHKPALSQNHWMQYALDTCMSVDEVIDVAHELTIDGWGWHYFVGDATGRTAAIAFIDGAPLVHTGEDMPIRALFNSPYDWEMEFSRMYEGHGGHYPVAVDDPTIPRFVRYDKLASEFKSTDDIVQYGLDMLATLKVHDEPEWSVLYDEAGRTLYFRTRLNPAVKTLAFDGVDFSNGQPDMALDIDQSKGGDVLGKFEPLTQKLVRRFLDDKLMAVLPEDFFATDGLTNDQALDNLSTHDSKDIVLAAQMLQSEWSNVFTKKDEEMAVTLTLYADKGAITGGVELYENGQQLKIGHIWMIDHHLEFTFFTPRGNYVLAKCDVNDDEMAVALHGPESFFGDYILYRD